MSNIGGACERLAALLLAAAVIGGCTGLPQREAEKPAPVVTVPTPGPAVPLPPAPAPPPPPPVKTFTAQKDLADGVDLYDRGEYAQAITKLSNLPDLSLASIDVQTTTLKYLAFSYCVTRRLTLCRTQFENAFKLDPAFDLKPAERGHPQWGPVFERVKKAQAAAPK